MELIPSYFKCVHCGAVHVVSEWEDNVENESYVCPTCHNESFELGDSREPHRESIEVKFIKANLDRLDEIKKEKSKLEKEEKKLAPEFKNFLVNNKITKLNYEGHNMVVGYQDRSTMDEEKLVALIYSVMDRQEIVATDAIKKTSNPAVITQLLKDGRITLEQIAKCTIPNIIPVFYLNPKEKKEQDSEPKTTVQSPFGGML